jgi:thymidine kinase
MLRGNFDESIFSEVGSISVTGGPMYAGKTSLAIGLANQRSFLGEKIIYINHESDNRETAGGVEGVFTSHNASNRFLCSMVKTSKVSRLDEVDVEDADLIIVDEGQLFPDLAETVISWADDLNKNVEVYCVDATFEQKLFDNVAKLLAHANNYTKVTGQCLFCIKSLREKGYRGKVPSFPTAFSMLAPGVDLDASRDGQIHIGGEELFVAACRRHRKILQKMRQQNILEIPPTPDAGVTEE